MPEHVFPAGLDQQELISRFGDLLVEFDDVEVLRGQVFHDGKLFERAPIGIVVEIHIGRRIEPHVEWLPWASSRNKLEGALKYLNVRRKQAPVIIWSSERDAPFFERLTSYALLRKVGPVFGLYDGKTGFLFQTIMKEGRG